MIQAQHTIVSPIALLELVQRHYPAIGASDCRLLALGCNDNFRIKGKRQDYAFRLYRYGWWPENDVDEELRFLETLQRRRLNICNPVRTGDKQRYIKVETAEGIRFGALFTFLHGRTLLHNFGKRNINMRRLGELLAQVHDAADNMKYPVQRWTINLDVVIEPFFDKAPSVLGHRGKDIAYLRKIATQLEEKILGEDESKLNFGFCHGDLHVGNVMLQPNGDIAIFDFDWSGNSWRCYDLATIWWSLPRDDKGIAPWRAFLRGYTQIRKLSRQEQKLLPWFLVFRHFEFLNFQLSIRKDFGDSWLNDNYYDKQIGVLKNWMKTYRIEMN